MTISTSQAAKTICALGDWEVTNLKLQKILYIAHKVFLGRNPQNPLIGDLFEAWDYGPVVPELYHDVKMFGKGAIQNIFWSVNDDAETDETIFLEEACQNLLSLSAGQLVRITHDEDGAWYQYYQPGVKGVKIPNEAILEEYRRNNG